MTLGRRIFLNRAAVGTAGLFAASRGSANAADSKTPATLPQFDENSPEGFWSAVRGYYPLSRDFTYFNTGGLGPTLEPVLSIIAETTRRLQAKSEHGHQLFAGARATV